MESRATQKEVLPGEKQSAGSSRRGFLQQAAAAGAGSAALGLLIGAAGSERAEAAGQIGLAADFFRIDVRAGNVTVTNPITNLTYNPTKSNGAEQIFAVPVRDVANATVLGGWWLPGGDVQNLPQFNHIEVYIDPSGPMAWTMIITPASGISNTGLTIATYALRSA